MIKEIWLFGFMHYEFSLHSANEFNDKALMKACFSKIFDRLSFTRTKSTTLHQIYCEHIEYSETFVRSTIEPGENLKMNAQAPRLSGDF